MKIILIMGPQGSGKKTQVGMLTKRLEEEGKHPLLIDAGELLREFSAKDNDVSRMVGDTMSRGHLVPVFVTVHTLTEKILSEINGQEYMIIDGFPRTLLQARILDSMVEFFNPEGGACVCHIDLSREESVRRLKERGRSDDIDDESIERRLDWSEKHQKSMMEYFDDSERYVVRTVDGEQTIEEVHQEIIKNLNCL